MAVLADALIAEALATRLESLPAPYHYAVAWPGKVFDPPTDQPWLRATFLPALPIAAGFGEDGPNRYSGIFQIDVFWPLGRGAKEPLQAAGAIADHFRRGTTLAAGDRFVQINRPPAVLRHAPDGAFYLVPVQVFYTADMPNQ